MKVVHKKKELKKVHKRFVTISQSEVIKKNLDTKYSKWQLRIAKMIKVEVADAYLYCFRINYKGNFKLKLNDVIINESGQIFAVLKELNRVAMVVSYDATTEKPLMYGKLVIVQKDFDKESKIKT